MRKYLKRGILLIATGVLLCTPATTFAESTTTTIETSVEPRVDAFKWKFKIINGKMYKRLFNIKTGEYVGEWILVE